MATISVIVPIYNVEEYLTQCLQSLIDQSYRDIEILLMDDGSTDSSSQICDSFAAGDDRVKVFHTTNQGISAACNLGIENAEGEFLMFVDGDDWVEPDYCAVPLDIALKEGADVVMFGFHKEGRMPENWSQPMHRGEIAYKDRFTLFEDLSSAYAWNKICRRELFDDIRFPVGYTYEDIPVTYKIFHKSAKMWYIDDMLYNYRVRGGSVTSTYTHAKENDHYETRMMAVEDLLSWGLKDEAEDLKCRTNFTYILRMDRRGKHTQDCIDYFKSNEYRKDVQSWRARLMVKAFLWFPPLFAAVSAHFGNRAQ